jgi:DinB family protein
VDVYLECGAKRTFAGALDWPGWCRQGPNGADALAALLAYGPKYASILAGTRLGFTAPKDPSQLVVVERLPGTPTTDFGAPGVAPSVDQDRSCSLAELKRFEKILQAGWRAFDETVKSARGKTLTTGPRGGGRSLEAIVAHVVEADSGYLNAVGWKAPKVVKPAEQLAATREAILAALQAAAAGELLSVGPRGGVRWTARYFVRRVAWHLMAHVWEIERRCAPPNPKG